MTSPDPDELATWQFDLPPELIASRPAATRDSSRLLVIERTGGRIQHRRITDLPDILSPHDLLVFNNTKVLPARLFGFRTATNGKWEGLFVSETSPGHWTLLCETRGRLMPGETITVTPAYTSGSPLILTLREKHDHGIWLAQVDDQRPVETVLNEFGSLPLPPYMGRKLADETDRERYQTQFASQPGAVAAPTAGLHFTPELLERCRQRGIATTELTLHVGIGTFRPVSTNLLSEHKMHHEWCRVTQDTCDQIESTRIAGGRTIAVGTTSVRTLESSCESGSPQAWQGETNLFIRPGYQFRAVDGLLTNFHLPGSTLIVLVAALAGYDLVMEAYRQAVQERYRFYSYGDAMLIL